MPPARREGGGGSLACWHVLLLEVDTAATTVQSVAAFEVVPPADVLPAVHAVAPFEFEFSAEMGAPPMQKKPCSPPEDA